MVKIRRIMISFLIMILVVTMTQAVDITRDVPSSIEAGDSFTVEIYLSKINYSDGNTIFLYESIPAGITLVNWSIVGADQKEKEAKGGIVDGKIVWEFISASDSAKVNYSAISEDKKTVYVIGPASIKNGSVLIYNESKTYRIDVKKIGCGDGVCEDNETISNCESDCTTSTTKSMFTTTTAAPTTTKKEESYRPVKELPKPDIPDIEIDRTPNTLFLILTTSLIVIALVFFVYHRNHLKRMK